MNKVDFIKKYGEKAYLKQQEQTRIWQSSHPEWFDKAQRNTYQKGGKYYEGTLRKHRTGLQGEKGHVRSKHGHIYRPFKQIIAPESQIHHEWIPKTANYRGVALVEKYQHIHGFIDVIQILEGKITLLSEAEIIKERIFAEIEKKISGG